MAPDGLAPKKCKNWRYSANQQATICRRQFAQHTAADARFPFPAPPRPVATGGHSGQFSPRFYCVQKYLFQAYNKSKNIAPLKMYSPHQTWPCYGRGTPRFPIVRKCRPKTRELSAKHPERGLDTSQSHCAVHHAEVTNTGRLGATQRWRASDDNAPPDSIADVVEPSLLPWEEARAHGDRYHANGTKATISRSPSTFFGDKSRFRLFKMTHCCDTGMPDISSTYPQANLAHVVAGLLLLGLMIRSVVYQIFLILKTTVNLWRRNLRGVLKQKHDRYCVKHFESVFLPCFYKLRCNKQVNDVAVAFCQFMFSYFCNVKWKCR